MVVDQLEEAEADLVFKALSDRTRRDILRRSVLRKQSISSLAADYEMSFAAVQKHVAVLERAALVIKVAKGREKLVEANLETVRRAGELLDEYERFWRARMEAIDAILTEEKGKTE
jgi:DNA-binding transcriptional ArsR family regulator